MLDPEPKDMYRCHPYHFMEICKPSVNEPIGSYQIHHLNRARFKLAETIVLNYFFILVIQQ